MSLLNKVFPDQRFPQEEAILKTRQRGRGAELRRNALFLIILAAFLLLWSQCVYAQATIVGSIPFPGGQPLKVAVYEAGNKVFVTEKTSQNLFIIDGITHETLQTIPVGPLAANMVVNETYGKVYVGGTDTTNGQARILVIDASTNELIAKINPGFSTPFYFRLANDEVHDKIYFGYYDGNGVIDAATNAFTLIPSAPYDYLEKIGINSVTNEIFITSYMEGALEIINGNTLAVETFAMPAGCGNPLDIAVNEIENKVYLTVGLVPDTGGKMGILILDRDTMGYKYAGADDLEPLAFNQSTNKLFTGVQVGSNASIIDGATDELTSVDLGGVGIGAIGIRTLNDTAYLMSDDATYIVSGATKALVQTIPTGHPQRGGVFYTDVAINQTTGRVYVMSTERDEASGEVNVLQDVGPKPAMTSPTPGSTLTSSTETFTWSAGSGATTYSIYIGRSVGGSDVYLGNFGTSLSGTISGLPTDGSTLYVRLYSLIGGVWEFNDYTYTAASVSKAVMTSPVPGSTLTSSTVTFTWSAGTGASMYALYVGTTAGGTEIYADIQGTSLSRTLGGLPTNGSTIHVRLWSLISGVWQSNDYSYTAALSTKAAMLTPVPGSTLTSATTTFTWSVGGGALMYALYVGTTPGGTELYADTQGTNLSATVGGLPTDGSTVYVCLWSLIGGVWQSNDYAYTAVSVTKAVMTSPAGGSALASSTVTFTWSAGSGVSIYALYVGTTPGGTELYADTQGTNLSVTVGGLPTDGSNVYVCLWSLMGSTWQYNDYTYTAASFGKAAMTSPTPGSVLTSSTETFTWSAGVGASSYSLYVGRSVGGSDIYVGNFGSGLSGTVSGLPTDGSTVYVRLYSLLGSVWQFNDYTYTAFSEGGFSLDGSWAGVTAQGKPITFTVSGGTITALSFGSHLVGGGGCTSDSTTTSSPISQPITGNAFSWSTTPAPGALSYSISGSFSSSTASSGSLDFTVTPIPFVPGCYGSGNTTWGASKI